jgi:DNA-binding response OmpR family regulator
VTAQRRPALIGSATAPIPQIPQLSSTTIAPVRALVVDDEPSLTRVVAGYLEHEGFVVTTAADGEQALAAARSDPPDVILLDLMLPGIDGIEVCRQLRTFTDAYVIMLTARSEEVDTLIGLSVGADDYMTKPFSPRELTARIRGLLRRPRMSAPTGIDPQVRTVGDLRLDPQSRQVCVGETPVELTRIEFDLLDALTERPKLAYTRRQLIERVWGPDWVGDEHLVDIHVAHIRSKLADDVAAPRFVVTIRGVGYRMGPG